MIRLSDLVGKRVRDGDGRALGRVREVTVRGGEVAALYCERPSWRGVRRHRIAWARVATITADGIGLRPR